MTLVGSFNYSERTGTFSMGLDNCMKRLLWPPVNSKKILTRYLQLMKMWRPTLHPFFKIFAGTTFVATQERWSKLLSRAVVEENGNLFNRTVNQIDCL